ncbi:MAG: tyrosine-type recombinase/integrase [Sphingomicrobium sp.]
MEKALLTDSKVRGLKAPTGKQVEQGDTVVPGLRMRVSGKAKTWVLRQRAGGKVRTITIGPFGDEKGQFTLAAARTRAIALKDEIDKGAVPLPASNRPRGNAGTRVRDVIDTFMAIYCIEKEVKRPESYHWMFRKYVLGHFGDWEIAAVKRPDLREFLEGLRDNHGMTTARRVGGLVKLLFKFAASRDVIEADPASALDLPGKEVVRKHTLKDHEIRALWRATDPNTRTDERNRAGRLKPHPSMFPWGAYFRLLLLLGQRRGEVANMRWASLDLEKGVWTLDADETKADRAHVVPLSAPAVELLKALPRLSVADENGDTVPSPWVLTTNGRAPISDFSKPKKWLDETMLRLLREDGETLAPWRVHDIRRSVSTNLAALGVEPFVRRRVLNHSLEGVDAVYDQWDYLEPKRRALDLWAVEIRRITEGEDHGNVISIRG